MTDEKTFTAAEVLAAIGVASAADVPAGLRLAFGEVLRFDGFLLEVRESCVWRDRAAAVCQSLGVGVGEVFPNALRRAIGSLLGLREPPLPEWAKPGAMVWSDCLGSYGGWVRIERITHDRSEVQLEGQPEAMPVGFFLDSYRPEQEVREARVDCDRRVEARMPAALRELAARLGGSFGEMTVVTRRRIAAACLAFAEIIEAAEDRAYISTAADQIRGLAREVLGALHVAALTADTIPMTDADETALLARLESALAEAREVMSKPSPLVGKRPR